MTVVLARPPAKSTAWARLSAELDAWCAAGRTADFWWRDDDAAEPTNALDRLLALAAPRPLTLAAIPASTGPALAARLAGLPHVTVIQHGVAHANNAPAGEKKSEFPAGAPVDRAVEDLAEARARMTALFGDRFAPVLAPPWNRIAGPVAAALARAGLLGLSGFAPRRAATGPDGAMHVNTHIDVIAWRAGGGFVGVDAALDQTVQHLRARREGSADPAEPTGLMTHHLVHDEAVWNFVARFADAIDAHPAARWVDPFRDLAGA